ncbi:hypothetical protein SHL15_7750 [Streptomyces hygroscopicus subsp. limoneus]|nr:hypothetical protein SHL15_7750 [Streptomyces hygroscopicus subsp. limoneus]
MILYGPEEEFDTVLANIQAAGIVAKRDAFEPHAISAFFHDGTDRPSQEFVKQCEDRVRTIADGTGFTVNRTGVWGSNAASRQLPYNRHTGEWLEEFVDGEVPLEMREEQLQRLAERQGISVSDIELRDHLTPPAA